MYELIQLFAGRIDESFGVTPSSNGSVQLRGRRGKALREQDVVDGDARLVEAPDDGLLQRIPLVVRVYWTLVVGSIDPCF